MVLGPRRGKYTENGIKPIPAHNFPLAAIGVFLLMFGWYGFNGGSVLSAEPAALGLVFTTTSLAACAGALGAMFTSWFALKKPDPSMALNGIHAGSVGLTANADVVSVGSAIIIGAIAGVIVVFAITFLDKSKIDDPVGAVSVHGVCGIWGTLSIGLFAKYDDAFLGRPDAGLFYGGGFDQLGMQAVMLLIIIAWVTITTAILFTVIKATIGLRVSAEEETEGLDVLEHGLAGYSGDSVSVGS